MSGQSQSSDVRTPMPRHTRANHYFEVEAEEDYDGVTQSEARDGALAASSNSHGSLEVLAAQHELVSRALTPDVLPSPWASLESSPEVQARAVSPMRTEMMDGLISRSESALSSRPGTPLSAPSNLPIPSNPSSFPEDQLLNPTGPLLVMPILPATQRKPFTSRGRHIGKLRVMFCGDSGAGKTTLLRTMIDRSPDIVYFENTTGSEPGRATTEINEVRASSQPNPSWKITRREGVDSTSSLGVRRNICLVDTPGYKLSAEADDAIDPIMRYIESQFLRTNDLLRDNVPLDDDEYSSLIATADCALTQVDVAIYCITEALTETDLGFLLKLSSFTSVIPVVTKSDLLDDQARVALRQTIQNQLISVHFRFYDPQGDDGKSQPYMISCLDPEVEASLMMDNDYIPQLVPSDLDLLLSAVMHDDKPARLRHYTAQKFLHWKQKLQQEKSLIHLPDAEMSLLPSADFTISRIAEHTKQEDTKARLRIAAWASEMRTSFAMLPHTTATGLSYSANEKSAEWLITRMNDYVEVEKRNALVRKTERKQYLSDESDPLGLLKLRERWARRLKRVCRWCLDIGFAATGVYLCYNLWQQMLLMD